METQYLSTRKDPIPILKLVAITCGISTSDGCIIMLAVELSHQLV